MNRPVVEELIQDALNESNLQKSLSTLLNDKNERQRICEDYKTLRTLLSAGGNASLNAAKAIWEFTSKPS